MNSWSGGFRSPSPADSSPSGDDNDTTAVRYTDLPPEAQLAKDLDLNSRVDRAAYKDTPFTLAKRRATNKPSPKLDGDAEPRKPRGNIRPVVQVPVGLREDNATRRRFTTAGDGVTKGWKPHNGWVDGKNNPIPIETTAPNILDALDEKDKETKGSKRKRGKTESARKPPAKKKAANKKPEEKLVFSRIPSGAKPSSDYPIVLGLEKQKNLPSKQSSKVRPLTVQLSSDSEEDFSIADLLKGGPKGLSTNQAAKNASQLLNTSSTKRHGDELNHPGTGKPSAGAGSRQLSGSRTVIGSGSASPLDDSDLPPSDHISTITHLPSSVRRALETSAESSGVPYSSPLQAHNPSLELIRPRPQRAALAARLEVLAALDEDPVMITHAAEGKKPNHARTSKPDGQVLREQLQDIERSLQASAARKHTAALSHRAPLSPTLAGSFTKRIREPIDPQNGLSAPAEEWSTLPSKKGPSGRSSFSRSSHTTSTLAKRCDDKFLKPLRLFDRRAPPREPSADHVWAPGPQPQGQRERERERDREREESSQTITSSTKVTLFTPSSMEQVHKLPTPSETYEIQTIRGSKYGATLTHGEKRPGPFLSDYEHVQRSDRENATWPRFTRDPAAPVALATASKAVDDDDDWTKAWRRPKSASVKPPPAVATQQSGWSVAHGACRERTAAVEDTSPAVVAPLEFFDGRFGENGRLGLAEREREWGC